MKCNNCGFDGNGTGKYCLRCGNQIGGGTGTAGNVNTTKYQGSVASGNYTATGNVSYNSGSSIQNVLVDNNERIVAQLSNSIVSNILHMDGISKQYVILTDKRLYVQFFSGVITKKTEKAVISVNDITGTKIIKSKPWSFIVFAILSFLIAVAQDFNFMFVVGAFAFAGLYYLNKIEVLRVEYAGGKIDYNVKQLRESDVQSIQNNIYRLKRN